MNDASPGRTSEYTNTAMGPCAIRLAAEAADDDGWAVGSVTGIAVEVGRGGGSADRTEGSLSGGSVKSGSSACLSRRLILGTSDCVPSTLKHVQISGSMMIDKEA